MEVPSHPGSAPEDDHFQQLQSEFPQQYKKIFSDFRAPRTVVILPSLTLDQEVLSKIKGAIHYEQRLLCLLFLLRYPNTKVIYLSSEPIPASIVDYYLHFLPGVPREHAAQRLELFSCFDSSDQALTAKILARPRLIEKIRRAIPDLGSAHITCFSVAELERTLAVRLGAPIYGCDPRLSPIGTKSGSRAVFRQTGVPMAAGFEDLADARQIAEGLAALKRDDPSLRRAVVKLNDGFSGEGNAVFEFAGAPSGSQLSRWVRDRLPTMKFVAQDLGWDGFEQKFAEMGGVVEEFLEGRIKRSPSVQLRVDPTGALETISTHEQLTGGETGQIFEGCLFPADAAYRQDIHKAGQAVGEALRRKGVLGRFGVDFICVREGDAWRSYAVEINLRKGGTTHTFLTLQFLTEGRYDPRTGQYLSRAGKKLFYYATDNLVSESYVGLTPEDLIEIAVENSLHFHAVRQEGVVFHLIGALSQFGKLGVVCVAGSPTAAKRLYKQTVAVLDSESRRGREV